MSEARDRVGAAHLRRALTAAAGAALFLAGPVPAEPPPDQGLHWQPHLGVSWGDHHADLHIEARWRWEDWKAFAPDWDDFHGIRNRFALDYRFRKLFRVFAQGQFHAVLGLTDDASGIGANYRSNGGGRDNPNGLRPSQLFAEITPSENLTVRVGRQFVNMGTLVKDSQPNWAFLQIQRLSQRLVGTVDWTTVSRAYDGGTGHMVLDGHHFHAFFQQPTTGVFVSDNGAFRYNKDILVGGVHWTAPRGTLSENTQVEGFFIGYSDNRNPAKTTGLFGDIMVFTMGGAMLGVYPLGPGRADVLLWGAFQAGNYDDESTDGSVRGRDQLAGAVLAEIGYQLHEVWGEPWLRFGVNWGSGDSDRDDKDRNTFFSILPTVHLHYGYIDQLALQNLVDLLVQFKLKPLWKLDLELTYHRFWLQEPDDFRWLGPGAFARRSLGFTRNASNGSTDVGHELDVQLAVPLRRELALKFGYSRLWGGDVFDGQSQRNASFAYTQVLLRY